METFTLEQQPTVVETIYGHDEYLHTHVMSDGSLRHYESNTDGDSFLIGTTSVEEVNERRVAEKLSMHSAKLTALGPDMVEGFYGGKDNIQGLGN